MPTVGDYRVCKEFGENYTLVQFLQEIAWYGRHGQFDASEFQGLLVLWSHNEYGDIDNFVEIWGTRHSTPWLHVEFELLWLADTIEDAGVSQ